VDQSKDKQPMDKEPKKSRFSRRGFLQSSSLAGGAAAAIVTEQSAQAAPAVGVKGPVALPITLTINGKPMNVTVEPRETLLDVLRNKLDLTGAKRVCDRGTCGACTIITDGRVMYGCTMLAIDAVGRKIQTIESLTAGATPHPVVPAFVEHDAQQCGYCTPGFVMAAKGLLDENPRPTYEQVKDGLCGNLCRCGTYVGVRQAVLTAAKSLPARGGRSNG
jgi:xanthine dehydrogenase YagT iron-sulfur-binding subunit